MKHVDWLKVEQKQLTKSLKLWERDSNLREVWRGAGTPYDSLSENLASNLKARSRFGSWDSWCREEVDYLLIELHHGYRRGDAPIPRKPRGEGSEPPLREFDYARRRLIVEGALEIAENFALSVGRYVSRNYDDLLFELVSSVSEILCAALSEEPPPLERGDAAWEAWSEKVDHMFDLVDEVSGVRKYRRQLESGGWLYLGDGGA